MRKGISQIISSVLLLAIAVSVAGVYSQWAPDFSRNTSQQVANQAENQLKCDNAAFDISSAEYDTTENIIRFETSNKGTVNFNDNIIFAGLNNSKIVGKQSIDSLEVEETLTIEMDSGEIPESIVGSSEECPDLRVTEERIDVK